MVRSKKLVSSLTNILLLGILLRAVTGQDDGDKCSSISTCNECIQNIECDYCLDDSYEKNRCQTETVLKQDQCMQLSKPQQSIKPVKNENSFKPISISSVSLDLLLGKKSELKFTVTNTRNAPLDLYILIDLSASMNQDIDLVKEIAGTITSSMRDITTDFTLGLGAFIDKTSLPFMNMDLMWKSYAGKTYNFRQYSELTKDVESLRRKITSASVSTNIDLPEDIFGASLQSITCKEIVGWRSNSRKILLVMSDDVPQAAGMEIMAQIFRPAEISCETKMNSTTKYYEWNGLSMGFPSISLMKQAFRETNVVPVFGYADKYKTAYKRILEYLKDIGAVGGTYTKDKNKFIEFIKEKYLAASKDIRLLIPESEDYSIEIKSVECPEGSNKIDNGCENVQEGRMVTYIVEISALKCLEDERVVLTVPAYDSINLNINTLCECPCFKTRQEKSKTCSSAGVYECKQCYCDEGRSGINCECQGDIVELEKNCLSGENKKICNGLGKCSCGVCKCNEGYYGKQCECSDTLCPIFDGKVCGGRGTCKCGECKCQEQYIGENCGKDNCNYLAKNCLNEKKQICNGFGTCECGKCKCDIGYRGANCEVCWGCTLKCSTYKHEVGKRVFAGTEIEYVPEIEEDESPEAPDNDENDSPKENDDNEKTDQPADKNEEKPGENDIQPDISNNTPDAKPPVVPEGNPPANNKPVVENMEKLKSKEIKGQNSDGSNRQRLSRQTENSSNNTVMPDNNKPSDPVTDKPDTNTDSCKNCVYVETDSIEGVEGSYCTARYKNCYFYYYFKVGENDQVTVTYLKFDQDSHCTKQISMPIVIGSTLGIVVLIGIIMIIVWKVIIYTIDKHEFKRFMMERDQDNWNRTENPLYRETQNRPSE